MFQRGGPRCPCAEQRQGHQQPQCATHATHISHPFRYKRRRRSMTTSAAAGDAGAFTYT